MQTYIHTEKLLRNPKSSHRFHGFHESGIIGSVKSVATLIPKKIGGRALPLKLDNGKAMNWQVNKIGVVGPGIVGMPMAAMLANAEIRIGNTAAAPVVVVQRNSQTSGWKVDAINRGRSPIGGVEPNLDAIVESAVKKGLLSASHDFSLLRDADVILICVQTDKAGIAPDYGPLMAALAEIARVLKRKPKENIPLVVFESTLAPSSMATVVRDHFSSFGLVDGQDILLGNSPNRVMPGRLVNRVVTSDKLLAGLQPITPHLIETVYKYIVTEAKLHLTNSLTAEVVKTLENAYRDVRIAFSTEVVRYCDAHNIDFYRLRETVNNQLAMSDHATSDPNAVPSGGLLIPMVGVGGHCLPKDGILLWWRGLEAGLDTTGSLILEARRINDESPEYLIQLAERNLANPSGRKVAILGAAYRFNSEDTRNSPSLVLARLLLDRGSDISIHDPFVKPSDQNLAKLGLQRYFSNHLDKVLEGADLVFVCTAHRDYSQDRMEFVKALLKVRTGIVDACNLYRPDLWNGHVGYCGIGRGRKEPDSNLIKAVEHGFRLMERGVANELERLIHFLNHHYAKSEFNMVAYEIVQQLAGTCVTGCSIARPGEVENNGTNTPLGLRLVQRAMSSGVDTKR
jgi:UDP-N-acetyl-D-mannosaminuronic acid dehydrogenase